MSQARDGLQVIGLSNGAINALHKDGISLVHLLNWYLQGGRRNVSNNAWRMPGLGPVRAKEVTQKVCRSISSGILTLGEDGTYRLNYP